MRIENLLLLAFCTAMLCYIVHMIWADRAATHLKKYMKHYGNFLKTKQLELLIDYGYGCEPGEILFVVMGKDVLIKRNSIKTVSLLRKIKSGKLSYNDLVMMSDTPYSEFKV